VSGLLTDPRLVEPDELYASLLALVRDVGDERAPAAFAALALVLANHVGDAAVVAEAVTLVRRAFADEAGDKERIVVVEALRRFFDQHPDPEQTGLSA
jgi:hypothetical protein